MNRTGCRLSHLFYRVLDKVMLRLVNCLETLYISMSFKNMRRARHTTSRFTGRRKQCGAGEFCVAELSRTAQALGSALHFATRQLGIMVQIFRGG